MNSGKTISLLKGQLIDQACRLKKMEDQVGRLEESHNKMSQDFQTAIAGSIQKDHRIEELEAKLKVRSDNDLMLSQSLTKVVKAVFGK